ncbi:hypothetical protein [Mycolicibacterium sp. XJ870]
MQAAARPYFAAGIALVGASAIAISPVAPPLPDIEVPAVYSAAAELTASANPLEAYLALVTNTVTNVQATIGAELADPAPILLQVIANQISTAESLAAALQNSGRALGNALDPSNPWSIPSLLQAAFTDLLEGDINGAVANVWSAFLTPVAGAFLPLLEPAINAIRQPVENLANVLSNPAIVSLPALGLLNTVYVTVTAAGNVGQDIVDSATAGDPLGVVNAMLSGPAVITDTFLNGGPLGGGVFGPSLGLLSTLRTARELIAAAITPPPEEASLTQANATLASAAKTVTLDVPPAEKPATATAPAAAAVAGETEAAVEDAETPAADADRKVATNVVKDSAVAVPGKTGTATKPARTNPFKQVRDGIEGTLKNVGDGITKTADGLRGKSKKSSSSTTSGEGDSSSSGGSTSDAA